MCIHRDRKAASPFRPSVRRSWPCLDGAEVRVFGPKPLRHVSPFTVLRAGGSLVKGRRAAQGLYSEGCQRPGVELWGIPHVTSAPGCATRGYTRKPPGLERETEIGLLFPELHLAICRADHWRGAPSHCTFPPWLRIAGGPLSHYTRGHAYKTGGCATVVKHPSGQRAELSW